MNLSWHFYKGYYRGNSDFDLTTIVKTTVKKEQQEVSDSKQKEKIEADYFQPLNNAITDFKFRPEMTDSIEQNYQKIPYRQTFELTTTYPGFLTGVGYNHGIGVIGEFKIGFYFDHTTGLPHITGSSIKGVLRNLFTNYPQAVLELLKTQISVEQLNIQHIETLELAIFGPRPGTTQKRTTSLYQQDTFLEAFINKGNRDQRILGADFITPHNEPLKNPTPLQFLKVLPAVTFKFNFQLFPTTLKLPDQPDITITADHKCQLFKQIILALGLGAKTNVGYGQFKEP